jgi:quinoprotein glucose dehydrogenase
MFGAVPYPQGVDAPKVRYYTGYGYEPLMISPPWSTLTAYDLNTGAIKWQIPYGTAPQAGPGKEPRGYIYPKSGVAVTAGGLIFFAGNDAMLHVVDRNTGEELWSAELPSGSQGVPAVYEAGGRQFVLVTATGGVTGIPLAANGVRPGTGTRAYVAFALPK